MGSPANVITITVKCDLDLDEIFGRVHVYTSQEKSMDWVLDEFCKEKNVRRVSTFALRSNSGQDYDLTKSIQQCGLGDGDLIFCYNKNPPKPKPPPKTRQQRTGLCNVFLVIGIVFLLIALAGIIVTVIFHETKQHDRTFAVVVDAGSTSSKIYLYSWPSSLIYNTGKVQQDFYEKGAAVSNSIDRPSEAATSIISIIRKDIINSKLIPSEQVDSTPLYLGATAGMRMLKYSQNSAVTTLFKTMRTDLKALNLYLAKPTKQIRIINGTEEGVDAWVTVNYLENNFGKYINNLLKMGPQMSTIGSLDLGGASTQIAFVPRKEDVRRSSPFVSTKRLYGMDYDVFSNSYLCYGKSQAQYRLLAILVQSENYTQTAINNPCMPTGFTQTLQAKEFLKVPCTKGKNGVSTFGYQFNVPSDLAGDKNYTFIGTGSAKSCKEAISKLFPFNTSVDENYQAPLNGKFKAFAGYWYVAQHFNVTATSDREMATIVQFDETVAKYCRKTWTEIEAQYGKSKYFNPEFYAYYCFDGFYILKLLRTYGFNSTNWKNLEFVKKLSIRNQVPIKDNKVGWSLGFTVLESGRIEVESFTEISLPLFIGLLILFCLVLVMALILFAVAWRNSRGRNRFKANPDATGYGSI